MAVIIMSSSTVIVLMYIEVLVVLEFMMSVHDLSTDFHSLDREELLLDACACEDASGFAWKSLSVLCFSVAFSFDGRMQEDVPWVCIVTSWSSIIEIRSSAPIMMQ